MSELENKVSNCIAKLSDASLPKYKRVVDVLMTLRGLGLSELSGQIRNEIEEAMACTNVILQRYELSTFEDYKNISEDHLSEIIRRQLQMCNNIRNISKNA
jgi:hypothetical protein